MCLTYRKIAYVTFTFKSFSYVKLISKFHEKKKLAIKIKIILEL